MLDAVILDQLKTVFAPLQNDVALVYAPSFHEDQAQLIELLEAVASTSDKISARLGSPEDGKQSP
jgi:NADH-dependent peroxiredoxin subunit F